MLRLTIVLLFLLALHLPLAAQDCQHVSPWFDTKCDSVPRENCWRYVCAPAGFAIERAPDHPWAYRMIAAPGTNGADVKFLPADFRVEAQPDGSRLVSVLWPRVFEGNVACPEYTLRLASINELPVIWWVFRNGLLLSPQEWQLLENPAVGGDYLIRTEKQASCPHDRFIVLYLLESEMVQQ